MTYTPATNFNGSDSFDYIVVDTWGDTDTATVDIIINPINDVPVASDVNASTNEDATTQINFIASDIDSAQLTFTVGCACKRFAWANHWCIHFLHAESKL